MDRFVFWLWVRSSSLRFVARSFGWSLVLVRFGGFGSRLAFGGGFGFAPLGLCGRFALAESVPDPILNASLSYFSNFAFRPKPILCGSGAAFRGGVRYPLNSGFETETTDC